MGPHSLCHTLHPLTEHPVPRLSRNCMSKRALQRNSTMKWERGSTDVATPNREHTPGDYAAPCSNTRYNIKP